MTKLAHRSVLVLAVFCSTACTLSFPRATADSSATAQAQATQITSLKTLVGESEERTSQAVNSAGTLRTDSSTDSSPDSAAKGAALAEWSRLLSATQQSGNFTLVMKLANPEALSPANRQLIVSNAYRWVTPLEAQWTLNYRSGGRHNGEVHVNNVQVTRAISRPLSAADRANGLGWDGVVQINYISGIA